jgi:hypothetical protein
MNLRSEDHTKLGNLLILQLTIQNYSSKTATLFLQQFVQSERENILTLIKDPERIGDKLTLVKDT